MSARDDLIARQHAEIQYLRERIRQLEGEAVDDCPAPLEWGLTATEALIYRHLVTRRLSTKASIMSVLYAGKADEPAVKIIDIFICYMRRKLRPHGVEIRTIRGRGYVLDGAPPLAVAA